MRSLLISKAINACSDLFCRNPSLKLQQNINFQIKRFSRRLGHTSQKNILFRNFCQLIYQSISPDILQIRGSSPKHQAGAAPPWPESMISKLNAAIFLIDWCTETYPAWTVSGDLRSSGHRTVEYHQQNDPVAGQIDRCSGSVPGVWMQALLTWHGLIIFFFRETSPSPQKVNRTVLSVLLWFHGCVNIHLV